MPVFTPRSCPLCGSSEGDVVVTLEAAEFCRTNWSYDPRWRELLALPDPAWFPLRRCSSCGLVYAALLPDSEFLQTLYERVIVGELCVEGSEHQQSYATRLRYVASLIEQQSGKRKPRALDFGSGAGVTLRILEACGVDAAGVEPSRVRAEYSGQRGSKIAGSLSELGGDPPFTIIILDNVLEHLDSPLQTLSVIASMAAPDAVAYVSVPNFEPSLLQRELEQRAGGGALSMTVNPWEHLNYFSVHTLDALMSAAGFEPVPAARLLHPPDIGLRPEQKPFARIKNGVASATRLLRWMLHGDVAATVERRFFRRRMDGDPSQVH